MIEARINLAGLEVRYPPLVGLFRRRSVHLRKQKRKYYDKLAEASQGNLREALILHLRSLTAESNGTLQAQHPEPAPPPKLSSLSTHSIACLVTVLRLGPLDEEELAKVLLIDKASIRQQTMALTYAGLLELDHRRLLRVPLHNVQPVVRSLVELGFQELHPKPQSLQ